MNILAGDSLHRTIKKASFDVRHEQSRRQKRPEA
jgi:hypothetical protein